MAKSKKELDDILVDSSESVREGSEKETKKAEKKAKKLEAKKAKADKKKEELKKEIDEIKEKISNESDEKAKKKLRKKRDELVKQRDAITSSKDGMTIALAPNTKKAIKAAVAVVVIIALLAAYFVTGVCRNGLFSFFAIPQNTLTAFTITDGDGEKHDIKVCTYNYYFAKTYNSIRNAQDSYNQYGMDLDQANLDVDFDKKLSDQTTENDDGETVTWAEYIQEESVESIKSTYTYYYEAVKANNGKEPKITDEQKDELNKTLDEYEETAAGYGYTLSGYLTAAMGHGVDETVFRREAKIAYIAENYKEDYQNELNSKEYDEEDYEAYRDEHKSELMGVDIRLFECDSADDAKAFVNALRKDGSNFSELASKYSASDFDKEAYKYDEQSTYNAITRSTLTSAGYAIATADSQDEDKATYPGLDWLYSSKRKAGDVKQYSTTVIYVLKPAYLPSVKPVNVRHILISPITDENDDTDPTEATDEQWATAKKTAEKILKEFKSGDKTAESFGKLAKENTADSNGEDGGLYENVTPNQMVPTFDEWCFDSSRKPGDTGIVKTKFGYHIMYFESKSKLNVWQYTAQQALASVDSEDAMTELEDSYKIKTNWFGSRYFEKDVDIDA